MEQCRPSLGTTMDVGTDEPARTLGGPERAIILGAGLHQLRPRSSVVGKGTAQSSVHIQRSASVFSSNRHIFPQSTLPFAQLARKERCGDFVHRTFQLKTAISDPRRLPAMQTFGKGSDPRPASDACVNLRYTGLPSCLCGAGRVLRCGRKAQQDTFLRPGMGVGMSSVLHAAPPSLGAYLVVIYAAVFSEMLVYSKS